MRILVADDMPANLESARQTLAGHDLTLCGTVEEACHALGFRAPSAPATVTEPFDAVLTDLWMPMPLPERSKLLGVHFSKRDTGGLAPVGLIFALRAVNQGTRFVAILTDSDHHTDPLVTVMDLIDGQRRGSASVVGKFEARFYDHHGAKDWGKVLARLMDKG